jgi:anti-sigma regulatory factor (Ser/Thr protein kinase)
VQPKATIIEVTYEAEPRAVGMARDVIGGLARDCGAGEEDVDRVRIAVSEAVSNGVLHAYGNDGGGSVRVVAGFAHGELVLVVEDDGCGLGQAAPSDGLGMGMTIIEQSCDRLTVSHGASGGTRLEMGFTFAETGVAPAVGERASSLSRVGR